MARKMLEKNIWYDDERKLYYVNLDYGKDKAGKRIRKTETFSKKKDAKNRLIEFEAEKLKGSMVTPVNTTFAEWLDYWMKNVIKPNREKTTYAGYEYIINRVKPELGNILLQKLTAMDIQLYLTELQDPDGNSKGKKRKVSSNTAKKHYVLIKTALNYAIKQKVLINNPANDVESPKYVEPDIAFYTPDQFVLGVMYVVFANTDSYTEDIDKRLPFRNNILHNGIVLYTDKDIDMVYSILIDFLSMLVQVKPKL